MVLAELLLGIQTGFDLLLIGSIMVVSGFVGIFTGSETLMLLLAVGLSVLYIAVGRKKIRRKITTVTTKTNIDKLVGSTGTVVRGIDPDTAGIIRVNDEEWRASAEEVLYERDTVVIEAIEGVTVIVRKLSK
jgi:membrane protein implicated in regulation of membrane protease activity